MNKYLLYDFFQLLLAALTIIGYYIYKYGNTTKLNFDLLIKIMIFNIFVVLIRHIHLKRKGKK